MVFRHCNGSGSGTAAASNLVGDDSPKAPRPQTAGSGEICDFPEVQTARFPVTFHPQVAGTASCTVTLSGPFGSQQVLLSGTGTLPTLAIDVQPPTLPIGDVRVGDPRPVPVTIRNIGSQTLMINSVTLSPVNAAFAVTGPVGPHPLQPGMTDTVNVTCTPPTTITFNTDLRVSSNAQNASTVSVPVSCRGIDSELVMNPPSPVDLDTRHGDDLV